MTDVEDLYAQFPRLRESPHRITSPPTDGYNCVAWVERDLDEWWEPGFRWPLGAPVPKGAEDLDCYVEMFRRLGFEECLSPAHEPGFEKIAIYAENNRFHHVAKQLASGRWSSKGGTLHDFRHELEALNECRRMNCAGVAVVMRRVREESDEDALEETGLILP